MARPALDDAALGPGERVRDDERAGVLGLDEQCVLRLTSERLHADDCRSERRQGCSSYCTLAVTDAAPFSVKVQLFDLLFVHAPEKIASRPSPTVSVIDVPTVNDADPVVPVTTFRPDGVLVT